MVDKVKKTEPTVGASVIQATAGEEMVQVSKADLSAILDRMASMEKNTEDLMRTAPNDQIARIEAMRRSGKLVKAIKVRSVEGKNVVGWKMIKDEVYFEGQRLIENQVLSVVFDDTTSKEMSLRDFNRLGVYTKFEVVRESKDADGNVYLVVMGKDGKEFEINQLYVN